MILLKQIKRVLSVNWLTSLRINLYYFPFSKAISFPILVGYRVHIDSLGNRNAISIPSGFGMLCFGLKHDPFHMGYSKSYWNIERGGKVVLDGTARFSKGTILNVFSGGILIIGDKFTSNANLLLSCAKSIIVGNDVLIGWNITIMDNDGGHVLRRASDNSIVNPAKEINIGNHVWISAEASILKGSYITEGAVIGYKSNVCGLQSKKKNAIIAGNPSKLLKEGILWDH